MSARLLKSVSTFSLMTLFSRITGFVREAIFAQCFGSSLDLFLIAYRIPNFLRRLLAEGSFNQAFIPVLSEYKISHTDKEVQHFIDQVNSWLSLIVVIIILLASWSAPGLAWLFAPGFREQPYRLAMVIRLLRIILPFLFFIVLSGFLGGILNSYRRFGVAAFAPSCFNLVMISVGLIVLRLPGHSALSVLAFGIVLAGMAQWLCHLPATYRLGKLPRFVWAVPGPEVKQVFRLMLPAMFGVSVNQINLLVNSAVASYLTYGTLSWLNYADRLASLPLGLFGAAIATVVLPYLSGKARQEDNFSFSETLDWGLCLTLLIAVPATLGLIILGEPIIATLFLGGKFNLRDLHQTFHALVGYAWGIPFFMVAKLMVSGFYARQDLRTPVKIATGVMVLNLVVVLSLFRWGTVGLASTTSVAALTNVIGLVYFLRKKHGYRPRGWGKVSVQILGASLGLSLFLCLTRGQLTSWIAWGRGIRMASLGVIILGAMVVYLGILKLMKFNFKQLLR